MGWSAPTRTVRTPEKVYEPAVPEAVTVYVKESVPNTVKVTTWPASETLTPP